MNRLNDGIKHAALDRNHFINSEGDSDSYTTLQPDADIFFDLL